jgi:hypothetical protein
MVYSRTRGGAYVRKVPVFTQPLTPDVVTVRAFMKSIGAQWYTTLTESQRQAWRALGQSIKWTNTLRGIAIPAGSDLFTQLNFNSLNAGGTAILNPPNSLIATDPGPISATLSVSGLSFNVTATNALPAGYGLILRATKPLNPGWYFLNKFLRQLRQQTYTIWSDTFTGTHPVPPWTASPYYTSSQWTEASNNLTYAYATTVDSIYAGPVRTSVSISCNIAWPTSTNPASGLIARLNTATGACYTLVATKSADSLLVYRWPAWPALGNGVFVNGIAHALGTTTHSLVWQIITSTHTIWLDGTQVLQFIDATLPTGVVGLQALQGQAVISNYVASALTISPPALPGIFNHYVAKFGIPTVGSKIGVMLQYVNLATGAISAPQTTSLIAAA